jgi:hypothetical protein
MRKKTATTEKENKFMLRTVPVRTDLEVARFLPRATAEQAVVG